MSAHLPSQLGKVHLYFLSKKRKAWSAQPLLLNIRRKISIWDPLVVKLVQLQWQKPFWKSKETRLLKLILIILYEKRGADRQNGWSTDVGKNLTKSESERGKCQKRVSRGGRKINRTIMSSSRSSGPSHLKRVNKKRSWR